MNGVFLRRKLKNGYRKWGVLMAVVDYEVINDISVFFEKKIIIYGAGFWGKKVCDTLKMLKLNPIFFCETELHDEEYCGFSVIDLKRLAHFYDSEEITIIIATDKYYNEIIEACEKINIQKARLCTLYGFFVSIIVNKDSIFINYEFKKNLIDLLEKSMQKVYSDNNYYSLDMLKKAADISENGVLIYQPGKVGSQSIEKSVNCDCVQFHTVVVPYMFPQRNIKVLKSNISKIKKKKLKIITGIREPISRDMAAFFQNSDIMLWPVTSINNNIFSFYGDYYNSDDVIEYDDFKLRIPMWSQTLCSSFSEWVNSIVCNGCDEFNWFVYELERVFGINVYNEPFDRELGYTVIKYENIELFIYQIEKLNYLEKELSEFLDDSTFKLKRKNYAEDKIYKYVYASAKEKFKLKSDYIDYYYKNNDQFNHFYNKEFRYKWEEKWRLLML